MAIRILEAAVATMFPLACALKGKWVLLILGFAAPALWVLGAARHAKPTSWWARRRDSDAGMAELMRHLGRHRSVRRPEISA